jgi:hypothetical protein
LDACNAGGPRRTESGKGAAQLQGFTNFGLPALTGQVTTPTYTHLTRWEFGAVLAEPCITSADLLSVNYSN